MLTILCSYGVIAAGLALIGLVEKHARYKPKARPDDTILDGDWTKICSLLL